MDGNWGGNTQKMALPTKHIPAITRKPGHLAIAKPD
jgi:hypothetical protein